MLNDLGITTMKLFFLWIVCFSSNLIPHTSLPLLLRRSDASHTNLNADQRLLPIHPFSCCIADNRVRNEIEEQRLYWLKSMEMANWIDMTQGLTLGSSPCLCTVDYSIWICLLPPCERGEWHCRHRPGLPLCWKLLSGISLIMEIT